MCECVRHNLNAVSNKIECKDLRLCMNACADSAPIVKYVRVSGFKQILEICAL